ncbi:hypothetical protein OAH18_01495 [bacterium]|nr:hypothetical protein [bacterium]
MNSIPDLVYVVQRRLWQYNDSWHDLMHSKETMKAFRSRDNAQLYCDALNHDNRENDYRYWEMPFRYHGDTALERELHSDVHDLTVEQFVDQISPHVEVPPPNDRDEISEWWDDLPLEQREKVIPHLGLFDNYTVVEIPTAGLEIRQA